MIGAFVGFHAYINEMHGSKSQKKKKSVDSFKRWILLKFVICFQVLWIAFDKRKYQNEISDLLRCVDEAIAFLGCEAAYQRYTRRILPEERMPYHNYLPKKYYDIQDEILIKMLMYVTTTSS
jgi:hypothetical protein